MIHVVVEGHGETLAMGKLLAKLSHHLGIDSTQFAPPRKDRRVFTEKGIAELVHLAQSSKSTGLLIIRDSEDDCPKENAPKMSEWIESLQPQIPVAYVLLYREFETLFLSVASRICGQELVLHGTKAKIRLNPNFQIEFDPERRRDAKGELNNLFPGNQIYKPTLHQLPLVTLCKIEWLEEAQLPSFGSLQRALLHLSNPARNKTCYP
ncbi:MAG TPA: hypothetical protein PK509_00710 [Catalimonadaceae bacterium]|nr:hypothetical protein [Catalimonadaceae bacterium]HPI11290.1 hypothetical protein [Catalimonadaceae bacterium]